MPFGSSYALQSICLVSPEDMGSREDCRRAHKTVPLWSPMSTLRMAMLCKIMTVAHI